MAQQDIIGHEFLRLLFNIQYFFNNNRKLTPSPEITVPQKIWANFL